MTIDQLRARLAELDGEMLRLVARRLELAREIGEAKDREGMALRDFGQEKEVVGRAIRLADAAGVSQELAAELVALLIRSSLAAQERQRVEARGGGGGRRALVIGGSGRMGEWFVRFLASQGFAVEVADPAPSAVSAPRISDWRRSELDHDVIVVAAPLRTSADILAGMATRPPRGLLFDIGSLKSPLAAPLRALADAGARVASLHPMFGPDTALLSGRHVIVVDVGHPEAAAEAAALFEPTMATIVPMDLESHDRAVAYVLGVSHALNIAFSWTLAESGETAGHLARLSSTTFDQLLGIAGRVAQENPHLYFEIQSLNRYGVAALDGLHEAVERVRAAVRQGDETAFVSMMQRGRDYFASRHTP